MKLSKIKFKETVYFENVETLFIDTKNKLVEIDYEPKTLLIKLTSDKDVCYSTITNVSWFKPVLE